MYGSVRGAPGNRRSYRDSWSLDGAKEMLQLRASVMSRRFWDDYACLLPSSPTPESNQTQLKAA